MSADVLSLASGDLQVERDGDLLTLTLMRAESSNALSPDLVEALITVLEEARDVRLCVIRGEGRHFCAGFDLSDLEQLSDGDLLLRFIRIEHLLQLVNHSAFPVAAFAHGQVVGAGTDLFAACWRRVTSPDAKFRMPGWNFELALGTRRLSRLIGSDAARDLLIDTKVITAEQAHEFGLASDVADPSDWPDLVNELLVRCRALPPFALGQMMALTHTDTRAQDMAAIVATAGRPGLKNRIENYRKKVTEDRARRRAAPTG